MTDIVETLEDPDAPDIETYRRRARAWISDNLERQTEPVRQGNPHDYDPSSINPNRALQKRLYDAGYAGITWPREYGGQGLSNEHEAAFREESEGHVLPDFGRLSVTTFEINVPTILAHASPEFLKEFIPSVLAGNALVCQFFSEPSSGSDLAGARTRASRDGDVWVLRGQKVWSTFAHLADWGLCLARTNWDVPKHRGLTWFVVPCNAPGVTIRPIKQIDETSSFCEDFFDDVILSDRYRVGDVDDGWTVTQTMLVRERGAGQSEGSGPELGSPGPLAPDLVELARAAGTLTDPVVRQKLARAHTIDLVERAVARRIAQAGRARGVNPGLAAYGKLFAGTYDPVRARMGLEIGGPRTMTWQPEDEGGDDVSTTYLNAREMSIAGGTNEMQRNGISERVLGLPREKSIDSTGPFSAVLRDGKNWTATT